MWTRSSVGTGGVRAKDVRGGHVRTRLFWTSHVWTKHIWTKHAWSKEEGRTVFLGLAASIVLAIAAQPGCTANPCQSSTPETPVPALECPAGALCYRGQCVKACNAGQERVTECEGDGDCSGPRSTCVGGFCSACGTTESCVPGLNICEAVGDIALPDVAPRPGLDGRVLPPAPLDDVQIEGGLVFPLDAGVVETAADVTHMVYIDVGVQVDGPNQDNSVTSLFVGALDVSTSTTVDRVLRRSNFRIEYDGPTSVLRAERELEQIDAGRCSLIRYAVDRGLPGADLGKITIRPADGHDSSMTAKPVELGFLTAGSRYAVTTPNPVPEPLLVFSAFDTRRYIVIIGAGKTSILDPWPSGSERNYRKFLMYPMDPDSATLELLKQPIVVDADQPQDISVGWNRDVPALYASTWKVVVRIRGRAQDIVCREIENALGSTNRLVVPSTLLRQLNGFESLAGRTLPIELERSEEIEQQIQAKTGYYVRMLHRVRHVHLGTVSFQ